MQPGKVHCEVDRVVISQVHFLSCSPTCEELWSESQGCNGVTSAFMANSTHCIINTVCTLQKEDYTMQPNMAKSAHCTTVHCTLDVLHFTLQPIEIISACMANTEHTKR